MIVISNALDSIPEESRFDYTRTRFDAIQYFSTFGFDPSPLDLRNYFGRTEALRDVLSRSRVIWAIGGNCFLLRRAMYESGFDQIIRGLLKDGIVYAGWSAGACVAGTSLRAVALMDEPQAIGPGYGLAEPRYDGLQLVPYELLPHFESDHPEAPLAAKAVQWAEEQKIKHLALRDGEVLIRNGENIQVYPRLTFSSSQRGDASPRL